MSATDQSLSTVRKFAAGLSSYWMKRARLFGAPPSTGPNGHSFAGLLLDGHPRGGPQAAQVSSASVDDDGVIELLATAFGGGPDRVDQIAEQYRRDPESAVLRASIAGDAVGMVGYTTRGTDLVILHIATRVDVRRAGIGRRMLRAVRDAQPGHQRLVAETDSEAVGFYIANGFVAESLGEKYPGVERFRVHALTTDPEN